MGNANSQNCWFESPAKKLLLALSVFCFSLLLASTQNLASANDDLTEKLRFFESFVEARCLDCHAGEAAERGFDLEAFSFDENKFLSKEFDTTQWEQALRRIDTRQMPPPDTDRPTEDQYQAIVAALAGLLDERAKRFAEPGTTGSLRRLTRIEYQNAVRDLLAVEIDAADFLPPDQSSHGFDNITVENLSPMLLNRYISAAQKISQAALGGSGQGPVGMTLRMPADRSQENHVAGLPFGTRGGTVFRHQFARSGEYEIELKLTRDRDEKVEGLERPHDVDILLDRKRVKRFAIQPPAKPKSGGNDYRDFSQSDAHLKVRFSVPAGEHEVAVTFPKTFASLEESKRQPFDANFNRHRHPRKTPALFQVSIVGPLADGELGWTASRKLIFGKDLPLPGKELDVARKVFKRLTRFAYRRVTNEDDIAVPMKIFADALANEGFEPAIEMAVASILANPNFLFRIESAPETTKPGEAYLIDDFELASRLSFFLWSSIPDDELLRLAEAGQLQSPATLRQQVKRMLADPKASSLVNNFASQWLYLRNLDSITPNLRSFPDFDDNLRQAFAQETKHLFRNVVENDLPVLNLIDSEFTFLNERLATHYGIGGVTGSHFRRVDLPAGSHRGGILRHGSMLMVTSYATRTAPTIRGNWVLENVLGTPAPPPPPNIPNLKENSTLEFDSVRERLAIHRENPACASCHDLMDPVGFSLENYDAVGRWRELDGAAPVDSAGSLPDGLTVNSVDELEQGILKRPQTFARTLAEKLMTFGLGRAVEAPDGPAIRQVVNEASQQDYRFSSIVEGIVCSSPFRMRTKP
jgi:hypothetical protein